MELLETWITCYGVWIIFVIIFFESLGAPLPGETILITGSVLASTGHISLLPLLIFAYAAAVTGDSVGYFIGYFGGRKILERFGYLIKLTPERLAKFENMMYKNGFYFVLTARFIVIARQLNGVISGASRMPLYKFLTANAMGGALWVACWGIGPYFLKHLFI